MAPDLYTKFLLHCESPDFFRDSCYKTNSDHKWLIYNDFKFCYFYGHFSESLDFEGLGAAGGEISTKLSTETLNLV